METTVIPVLPTESMAAAVAFYTAIGFETDAAAADEYGIFRSPEAEIHVSASAEHDPRKTASCLYIRFSSRERFEAYHTKLSGLVPAAHDAADAVPGWTGPAAVRLTRQVSPIRLTEYGMLQFHFGDHSNNLYNVGVVVQGPS